MEDFIVGNIVKGEVTGIEPYGIFIKINEKYSGLVHISEITNGFVKNINNYVKIGESVYAKIIDIDDANCNLKLSFKGINYRYDSDDKAAKESVRGFSPLQEKLPIWTDETLRSFE